MRAEIEKAFINGCDRMYDLVEEVLAPDTKPGVQIMNCRVFRNYGIHYEFPRLINFLRTSTDTEVRTVLMEALGWHYKSVNRQLVLDVAKEIADDPSQPAELRNEALKTYNRMK